MDAGPAYSEPRSTFGRPRCCSAPRTLLVADRLARPSSPWSANALRCRLYSPADKIKQPSTLRLLTCVVVPGLPILYQDHVKPPAKSLYSNSHFACRRLTCSYVRSLAGTFVDLRVRATSEDAGLHSCLHAPSCSSVYTSAQLEPRISALLLANITVR